MILTTFFRKALQCSYGPLIFKEYSTKYDYICKRKLNFSSSLTLPISSVIKDLESWKSNVNIEKPQFQLKKIAPKSFLMNRL